jgi:hypothetical protein
MTRINIEVPDDLHKAFKTISAINGLKIKEALEKAMLEFIENHNSSEVHFDIKVIQNNKKDLITFVIEEQLKDLVQNMLEAKKRNAPRQYINELKKQALDLVKKHPAISKDLAEEIVQTFQILQQKQGSNER